MFTAERFAGILRQVRRVPGRLVPAEAAYRFRRAVVSVLLRARDASRSTYLRGGSPESGLRSFAPALDLRRVADLVPDLPERCGRYLEQRFDLLGSGWRTVVHGTRCQGFEGHRYEAPPIRPDPAGTWLEGQVLGPNLEPARAVWRLLGSGYRPVDWHLDFRSGYRWSPLSWYRAVPYAHLPGVDVKVPWELARMQHLPQLALAFGCARAGLPGFLPAGRYRDGFRNQVLDFVATNPPRYGVNWNSTMEVAIRVANCLLAHDLLRAFGAEWDAGFEAVFVRSVREHGRHIAANLERSPSWRNNHYLTNLIGLIFAAAYLGPDRETSGWWRTAAGGLASEIEHQFLADGGHFEASTGYHAFASEVAAYGVAMIFANRRRQGVPSGAVSATEALPAEVPYSLGAALGRMGEFLVHMTKPCGRLAQIGDHDSGRLFKLQPRPRIRPDAAAEQEHTAALDEEHLDGCQAVAAINGLLGCNNPVGKHGGRWLNESLVAGLVGETPWRVAESRPEPSRAARTARALGGGFESLCERVLGAPAVDSSRVVLVAPGASLLDGLQKLAYPDFGAYVLRSERLFLCLRAGGGVQHGAGGHAHADQLALEVCIDGVGWIQDPGSYVYTADAALRNRYRSSHAHFVPYMLDAETELWRRGLFDRALDAEGREVGVGCAAIAVDLLLEGTRIGQTVTVGEQEIVVETRMFKEPQTRRPRVRCRAGHAGRYVYRGKALAGIVPFSPGYGLQDGTGK